MSSRPPGSNSRGRGGKFKKPTRGGGKQFSRSLRPVDADGNEISMWSAEAQENITNDSGDEDEDEDAESESDDDDGADHSAAAADESREARKEVKKARKAAAIAKQQTRAVEVGDLPPSDSDDDEMPANLNHSASARRQVQDLDKATEGVEKLSVKAKAKEDEAKENDDTLKKSDLERLALIREEREQARKRRMAEEEERKEQEEKKKAEIGEREAKKRDQASGSKKGGKKKSGK